MKVQLNAVEVVPVVQAAAYAADDVMGGKNAFVGVAKDNRGGYITSVVVTAKDVLPAAIVDVFLFDRNPADTTFTENGAFALATTDAEKCIGSFQIAAADWIKTATAGAVASKNALKIPFNNTLAETLYLVMVARAAITPASVSSFTVRMVTDQN